MPQGRSHGALVIAKPKLKRQHSNREKDPEDCHREETMTEAQASYLRTLCEEAGYQGPSIPPH
jgi:hypothetical protein